MLKAVLYMEIQHTAAKALNTMKTRLYNPGEHILRQGDAEDCFFILRNGQAGVYLAGQKIATIEEGALFGEITGILCEPRSADVIAESKCEICIAQCDMEALLSNRKALKLLADTLEKRVGENARQLKAQGRTVSRPEPLTAMELSIPERVHRYLEESARALLDMNARLAASHIDHTAA